MAEFVAPPDLFRVDGDRVHLLASRSAISDHLVFPAEPGQEVVELGTEGVLFTWTTQEFPPPVPPALPVENFEPFGVGYLEFAEGLMVEGRLTTCRPQDLTIGGRMKVVAAPYAGGQTFAFAPVVDGEDEVQR